MTTAHHSTHVPSRQLMFAAAVALATLSSSAGAQTIASRVARVREGTVRMTFGTRPDICGRGSNIMRGSDRNTNWGGDNRRSPDVEFDNACDYGPGRLVLRVRDSEIVGIKFYVGGRWRAGDNTVTDLGTLPARAAADYLISLASTLPSKPGSDAIFPATTADSADVAPPLLRLARDDSRPRDTRRNAVFWLGQMAGDRITERLDELARSNVDRDVAESAIFALSQRPDSEGVPALIRIVRTPANGELRKKALFWLGQSDDPRALALIEELLLKR